MLSLLGVLSSFVLRRSPSAMLVLTSLPCVGGLAAFQILNAQEPVSNKVLKGGAHDEHLFIVIHQVRVTLLQTKQTSLLFSPSE